MIKHTAVAVALTLATSALAEASSGNFLYEKCNSQNATARVFCRGFLLGIVDGMAMASPNEAVCGDDITAEQLRLVFMNCARRYPERLNLHHSEVAAISLMQAFPCKEACLSG